MTITKKKLSILFTLVALAGIGACVDGELADDDVELDTVESAASLIEGKSYCVDQSTASAYRTAGDPFFEHRCSTISPPPYNTQLSHNHPVQMIRNCAGPYVWVWSYWNHTHYMMRADALRRC